MLVSRQSVYVLSSLRLASYFPAQNSRPAGKHVQPWRAEQPAGVLRRVKQRKGLVRGLGRGVEARRESRLDFLACGHVVADVDEIVGNHAEADPSFHPAKSFVS